MRCGAVRWGAVGWGAVSVLSLLPTTHVQRSKHSTGWGGGAGLFFSSEQMCTSGGRRSLQQAGLSLDGALVPNASKQKQREPGAATGRSPLALHHVQRAL